MYRRKASVGGIEVAMGAWCPNEVQRYGIENWSLRPIQKRKDARRQQPLVAGLYVPPLLLWLLRQ